MRSHERLVRDYLDRLERALVAAPRDRQREISAEIEAHIREEISELGRDPRDHELLQILDRMGEPELIAEDAYEGQPQPVQPRSRALEVFALLFLTVGGFVLPILGWIVGLILLWISQTWSTREKILGTCIPLSLAATFYGIFLFSVMETCTGGTQVTVKPGGRTRTITEPLICESSGLEPWLSSIIFVGLVVAAISLTFYLAWRVAHPRTI